MGILKLIAGKPVIFCPPFNKILLLKTRSYKQAPPNKLLPTISSNQYPLNKILPTSGVAQNKGYNNNCHIIYVLFFVVTFVLCNSTQQDPTNKILHSRSSYQDHTTNILHCESYFYLKAKNALVKAINALLNALNALLNNLNGLKLSMILAEP